VSHIFEKYNSFRRHNFNFAVYLTFFLHSNTGECVGRGEKISVGFRICAFAGAEAIGPKRGERRAVEMGHAHR